MGFKWWTFLLIGSITLGFFIILYRKERIKIKKLDDWQFLKTGYGFVMAVAFIIVGIVGFFVPKILAPANKYLQATQNISDIGNVFVATFWQIGLFCGFVYYSLYKPLFKKDRSEFWGGIFLIFALVISWVALYIAGGFRQYFVDPFVDLYNLIF